MTMNKISKKTKTLLEEVKTFLFYLSISIGASFILVAPLLHKLFPSENINVVQYEKLLNLREAEVDYDLQVLRNKLKNNTISGTDYINKSDALILYKNNQAKTNSDLLKNKVNQERIFGWKTYEVFVNGFGTRIVFLLYAFVISFLVFKINTDNKYMKNFMLFVQIIGYTSAFYQIIWCFWYSQDYPLSAYLYFAIALCMLLSICLIHFITYRELFKLRLQKMVDAFSLFIVKDAKKHIKHGGLNEYIKDYLKSFKKGIE